MKLADIRAAQPERLAAAAEHLGRIRDGIADAGDRLDTGVAAPLTGAWQGAAGTAALGHIADVRKELAADLDPVAEAGKAVLQFGDALTEAKRLVADADSVAAGAALRIGEDGSIHFPDFWAQLTAADQETVQSAARTAADLLTKALSVADGADAVCAGVLAAGAIPQQAAKPPPQGAGKVPGEDGGGGLWGSVTGAVGDFLTFEGTDFDNSMMGDVWGGWTDSDRSIMERIWLDDDGAMDPFDLEPWEEEAFGETPLEASPTELFGEDAVQAAHEDGIAAGVDEWWDDSWEDIGNVPDRISDGVGDFVDDPLGTVGGWMSGD
ncbi:MAG TPA: WXG100 family type VII secretion target [Actinophytocola sp.]|uniref:WXG100 family type VII secretion target n=1 Tax=Actinophytocola sp. TaxID=1872138 RepID=UPI002DBE41A9|nr:WXG100 family type VII secretion target [Actinophytocola sp.]HEU5472664.1 WXG100 family type VII secretion target [Actinophytocola sp.]